MLRVNWDLEVVIGIEGDSSRGRVACRPMKTNDLRNNASHAVHYTSPNVQRLFRNSASRSSGSRTSTARFGGKTFSQKFPIPCCYGIKTYIRGSKFRFRLCNIFRVKLRWDIQTKSSELVSIALNKHRSGQTNVHRNLTNERLRKP